jgi:hypothetical protein
MRALLLAAPVLSAVLAALRAGVWWGRRTQEEDPRLTYIREHSRLAREASRAYRRNRVGEANILNEAAERVLDVIERKPEPAATQPQEYREITATPPQPWETDDLTPRLIEMIPPRPRHRPDIPEHLMDRARRALHQERARFWRDRGGS